MRTPLMMRAFVFVAVGACALRMNHSFRSLRMLLAATLLGASAATATEVFVERDGRTLRGTLELVRGKSMADGVILMVHGTMGHRDMDVMRHFRNMLKERGHSTLAINLALGVDRRLGMFDCATKSTHRPADTTAELGAWLDFAASQGARRVTLLGFSRGGQQAAAYAATHSHPSLAHLVLLAPIVQRDFAQRYAERFGQPLGPLLDRARVLARGGRGATLIEDVGFLNCERTAVSAESFLAYYDAPASSELPATLPRIGVPTLLVVAGADQIAPDLDKRLGSLADGKRLRMTIVPGADHFLRDLYGEDAADAIDRFLRP